MRPESMTTGLPEVPTVPTALLNVATSADAVPPDKLLPGAVPPQLPVSAQPAFDPVLVHVALAAFAWPFPIIKPKARPQAVTRPSREDLPTVKEEEFRSSMRFNLVEGLPTLKRGRRAQRRTDDAGKFIISFVGELYFLRSEA